MTEQVNVSAAQDFVNAANMVGADVMSGIVTNAAETTLRYDEYKKFDAKLLHVARQRLNGIQDLQQAGLVTQLGGLGVMLSLYERAGDMNPAVANMDGMTTSENDRVTFDQVGVPIPIFSKDWSINKRQLEASRTRGEPLSTVQMQIATRMVADKMETTLFSGLGGLQVDGQVIHGYMTHPDRNTFKLSAPWGDAAIANDSATNVTIVNDVTKMLDIMYMDNKFGPFTLYVDKHSWAAIQQDYNSTSGITVKDRVEAFDDIMAVRPAHYLPNGNAILVQMTEDVVDLAVAQDIVNVEWQNNPMQSLYKVYAAMAPRIKSDRNRSCGIVHAGVQYTDKTGKDVAMVTGKNNRKYNYNTREFIKAQVS